MAYTNTTYEGMTVVTTQFEEKEIVITSEDKQYYMYASGEVDWDIGRDDNGNLTADMVILHVYDLVVYNEDNQVVLDYTHTDPSANTYGFVNAAEDWLQEHLETDWDAIRDVMDDLKYEADVENNRFRSGYYELGDPDE